MVHVRHSKMLWELQVHQPYRLPTTADTIWEILVLIFSATFQYICLKLQQGDSCLLNLVTSRILSNILTHIAWICPSVSSVQYRLSSTFKYNSALYTSFSTPPSNTIIYCLLFVVKKFHILQIILQVRMFFGKCVHINNMTARKSR